MINHPVSFKIIAHTLYELQLADKSLIKFAEHQMNTIEKRKRVYYSWVVFRHLKFNLPNLTELINNNNIYVTLIAGKKDSVITLTDLRGFVKKLKHGKVELLDTGHHGILKNQRLAEIIQ